MLKSFQCSQCGKTFKKKFNYENHIFSTRFPCNAKITLTKNGKQLLISPTPTKSMVPEKVGTIENQKSEIKDYEKLKKFFVDIKKDGKKITICKFCGMEMLTDFEINNHFSKKWCAPGNSAHDILNVLTEATENSSEKNEKNNSMTIFNTQIHNHINTQVINNYQEITNVVNNNLNIFSGNEKVNPFGKENLDILTNEILDSIIENPNGGLVNLIRFIHFNPDVPENRNVVMKNKKDSYFNVFNGDYWEKQDKDTAIHNLISTKKDIMDDHFENMIEKKLVSDFMVKNYNDFSDLLDPYLKDNLDSLISEKLSKKNITKKCESIYKKLYGKIMLVMINDKEINKVLQRKLKKLEDNIVET